MRDETSIPHTDYTTQAFDDNRVQIDRIIIHSTVCTVQAAINTFSSPNAKTSAHYIIGNDGKLYSGLEEYFVAYHAGNYAMNQRSIGIEHEWYPGIHPSDSLYWMSGKLVRDICEYYGLKIDATTIIPHKAVVATACPNEIDVSRIIAEANGSYQSPSSECEAKLAEKTKLETFLRGEIEKKDAKITELSEQLRVCQQNNDSLLGRINNIKDYVSKS